MSLHKITQRVFGLYSLITRNPANWKEESERLRNTNGRGKWIYDFSGIDGLSEKINNMTVENDYGKDNIYQKFYPVVASSSLRTAKIQLDLLGKLKKHENLDLLGVRKYLYDLDFDYKCVQNNFERVIKDTSIKKVGMDFFDPSIPAETAKETAFEIIEDTLIKFQEFTGQSRLIDNELLSSLKVRVLLKDDPSFIMRCVNKSGNINILLNKKMDYNTKLLKFGILHEFCGHVLERAYFDFGLVKDSVIPEVYSYNDISSQTVFDVKSELFADRMAKMFLEKNELKYFNFRKNTWITCRAMGDYIYNIKGKNIGHVIQLFSKIGMNSLAFEESLMSSLFIDGFQGQYFFADKLADIIQRNLGLSEKQFMIMLLLSGKIPLKNVPQFVREMKKSGDYV